MLGKGHKTQAVFRGPQLQFSIISSCSNEWSIWWVGDWIEVKEVALLLHNIRFTLPFPNEQLSLLFGTHRNPFARRIYTHTINLVLRYLETMYRRESVKVVQAENAIRLADNQNYSRSFSRLSHSWRRLICNSAWYDFATGLKLELWSFFEKIATCWSLSFKFTHKFSVIFGDLILMRFFLAQFEPFAHFLALEF